MKVGLIGNPNVGKSLIFSQLTGVGVEISNYPGTTVDLQSGRACYDRRSLEILDLPGIYSLDGSSDEEVMVREMIQNRQCDDWIIVLDASHLERNLYLLLQVLEYRLPTLLLLNMMDEAEGSGIHIDAPLLSEMLGVRCLETAASIGRNIGQIIPMLLSGIGHGSYQIQYDQHIEAALRSLNHLTGVERQKALLALQGIGSDPRLMEAAVTIRAEIEEEHQMSVAQIIAANRHRAASKIASSVLKQEASARSDLDRILTRTVPGIPIMILVLIAMLATVFTIGSFLEDQIVDLFQVFIITPLSSAGLSPLAYEVLFSLAIAIQAGLGIAFPYVFTFSVLISVLEDSGYMTRVAFLSDRAMHRFGLHGQAIIPMVLGFGCTVPAIMGIRQLPTRRERIIAAVLITMVPCSARTVIIAGIVAAFLGILWAFSIYLLIFIALILTGLIFARTAPGKPRGMVLEIPPLRLPIAIQVIRRSSLRIKEFLGIAMPLLMVSSVILGLLSFYGIIPLFQSLMAPFMEQILGLPGFASTALLFGILRKEMAFETLIVLAGTANLPAVMSSIQLYIFAVVSTLFIPCISTIAVLSRELGWRMALLISGYTVLVGMGAGFLLHLLSSL